MVYVGLISYSLYLWHWPLIVLAQYANGMDIPAKPYLLFAISVLLASASYHFVEQPFRRGPGVMPQWALPSTAAFVALVSIFCIAGLVKDGFADRYDAKVVRLDKLRLLPVPYSQCFDLPPDGSCFLGHAQSQPDILLWGDSHLVAWAPALDASLLQARRRAVLATFAACPPLLGMENGIKRGCAAENAAVAKYLIANPKIKTVVLTAFWSTYFRDHGPLKMVLQDGARIEGVAAAQRSLDLTRKWLEENGRTVILVGPVPVYDKDVPPALALEALTERRALDCQSANSGASTCRSRPRSMAFNPVRHSGFSIPSRGFARGSVK